MKEIKRRQVKVFTFYAGQACLRIGRKRAGSVKRNYRVDMEESYRVSRVSTNVSASDRENQNVNSKWCSFQSRVNVYDR